jgi:hypothetical protein
VRLNLGGSVHDPTDPYGLMGLSEGDADVIRNAGGVITDDEVRSLTISQRLLGTREIILIRHTDCGIGKASDVGGGVFCEKWVLPPVDLG